MAASAATARCRAIRISVDIDSLRRRFPRSAGAASGIGRPARTGRASTRPVCDRSSGVRLSRVAATSRSRRPPSTLVQPAFAATMLGSNWNDWLQKRVHVADVHWATKRVFASDPATRGTYLQALLKTGTTGLEPATSGVTGRYGAAAPAGYDPESPATAGISSPSEPALTGYDRLAAGTACGEGVWSMWCLLWQRT